MGYRPFFREAAVEFAQAEQMWMHNTVMSMQRQCVY